MNLLFGFSGRTGRGGWWLGQFAIMLVSIACAGVIFASEGMRGMEAARDGDFARLSASMVALLFSATVLTVWMGLAVSIKRFHDRDKSGLWILIIFVPVIGPLWQFIECGFLAGSDGMNRFGPPGDADGGAGLADRLDVRQAYARPEPAAAGSVAETGAVRRSGTHAFGRRTR